MSARATERLRELWGDLSFFTVSEVIARQPEDVSYIDLRKPPIGTYSNGEKMYNGSYRPDEVPGSREFRTLTDVPEPLRADARIVWKRFTAYTQEGVSFTYDAHRKMDFTQDATLDFEAPSNHPYCERLPVPGELICGTTGSDKGVLDRWFFCDEAFRLLVTSVRNGPSHSEEELGRLLLTDGYPDTYWALARLAFFDNVQAFVDALAAGSPARTVGQLFMGHPIPDGGPAAARRVRHPAHGSTRGRTKVDWHGMYLGLDLSRFVHEASHLLEPAWWEEFLTLADAQGVDHAHPGLGGICRACMAEDPDWPTNGFPYQTPEDRAEIQRRRAEFRS
ncbi:hypothetical protein AB0393_28135 [Streptomyces cyaneofuscatus]|uniref:hypothetical protein n=1 Tax=Streptomyces cyaneofuscatus TaxID=66883 RepID=UPI00344E78B2